MENKSKSMQNEIFADILARIVRCQEGIERHQKSEKPSRLAIVQYVEMRDEMVASLLDYLVELSGREVLEAYLQKHALPAAA